MYDRIVAAGTSDIPQISDPQPVPAALDDQELVDNYGFPFEPEGIYNSAMLDFEEVAEALFLGRLLILGLVIQGAAIPRLAKEALQLLYELLVTRVHGAP